MEDDFDGDLIQTEIRALQDLHAERVAANSGTLGPGSTSSVELHNIGCRAKEAASQTLSSKKKRAKAQTDLFKNALQGKMSRANEKIIKVREKVKDKTEDLKQQGIDLARTWVATEALRMYDEKAEEQRVFALGDPDFPKCLKPIAQSAYSNLAPHFREEFLANFESVVGLRERRGEEVDHGEPSSIPNCWRRVRAWYLYVLAPYDKSIFGAARRLPWWVLKASMCCSYLGVSSLSFAALLSTIDREDSYQLVKFIFLFKAFQFWFSGVLELLMVSWSYSVCIIVHLGEDCGGSGIYENEAGSLGPSIVFGLAILGFCFQIILVWVAMYLLRFSVPKGGSVRRGQRLVGNTVMWHDKQPIGSDGDSLNSEAGEFVSVTYRYVTRIGKVVSFDRKTELHEVFFSHDGQDLAQASSTGAMAAGANDKSIAARKTFDSASLEPNNGSSFAEQYTSSEHDHLSSEVDDGRVQVVDLHATRYFVKDERPIPLQKLLFWDLCCFVFACLAAGGFLLTASLQGTLQHGWQWRAALAGARIAYSLGALPFFFCSLPPYDSVFTHARKTGYNIWGKCVPTRDMYNYPWIIEHVTAIAALKKKEEEKKQEQELADAKKWERAALQRAPVTTAAVKTAVATLSSAARSGAELAAPVIVDFAAKGKHLAEEKAPNTTAALHSAAQSLSTAVNAGAEKASAAVTSAKTILQTKDEDIPVSPDAGDSDGAGFALVEDDFVTKPRFRVEGGAAAAAKAVTEKARDKANEARIKAIQKGPEAAAAALKAKERAKEAVGNVTEHISAAISGFRRQMVHENSSASATIGDDE